jgi:hypothetical protein
MAARGQLPQKARASKARIEELGFTPDVHLVFPERPRLAHLRPWILNSEGLQATHTETLHRALPKSRILGVGGTVPPSDEPTYQELSDLRCGGVPAFATPYRLFFYQFSALDDFATCGFPGEVVARFDPSQGLERLLNLAPCANRRNPDGATKTLVPENIVSCTHG